MSTLHNPPELCYTTTTETTSALEAPSAPTNEALENAIRGELFSYWTSREEMFKHRMQAGRLLNVLRKSTPYGQWLPALKRIGVPERRAQYYMRWAKFKSENIADCVEYKTIRQIDAAINAQNHRPVEPLEDHEPDEPTEGESEDEPERQIDTSTHARHIFSLMSDDGWWTIPLLEEETGIPYQSISAIIRSFRRDGHRIERRHITDGLYEYHLTVKRPGVEPTEAPDETPYEEPKLTAAQKREQEREQCLNELRYGLSRACYYVKNAVKPLAHFINDVSKLPANQRPQIENEKKGYTFKALRANLKRLAKLAEAMN